MRLSDAIEQQMPVLDIFWLGHAGGLLCDLCDEALAVYMYGEWGYYRYHYNLWEDGLLELIELVREANNGPIRLP